MAPGSISGNSTSRNWKAGRDLLGDGHRDHHRRRDLVGILSPMIQSDLPVWPDRDKVPPADPLTPRFMYIPKNIRYDLGMSVASEQKSCIEFHRREPWWRRVWRFFHG